MSLVPVVQVGPFWTLIIGQFVTSNENSIDSNLVGMALYLVRFRELMMSLSEFVLR